MKKILLSLATCVSLTAAMAQSDKYQQAMETQLATLDTATNFTTYLKVSNTLERIANAEKTQWLPFYWASYAQSMAIYTGGDKKRTDEYADRAEMLIKKADSLQPKNSEVITMLGFSYQTRIQVNPMVRGQKFGTLAAGEFDKAIELDKTNPRPLFLKAQGIFYTPAMFGGGKTKACPVFTQSVELYATFKAQSKLHPNWGENTAKKFKEDSCK